MERLLPHIHRSVVIRQALAAADALGAGLAGLLDNDRIGVVQLDRGGRVLEVNAPALEVLRHGEGLVDREGTLDARLPADRTRLRRLLGRALPDFLGEAPSGGSMTVQRPSGRSRLALHVMPVGDAAADFGGRRVAALVLVVDPARRPRIDAQRVAVTLGLTASEGRMAALLAEGLRVREIAAAAKAGARATCAGWSSRPTASSACRGRSPWCGRCWRRTPCRGAEGPPGAAARTLLAAPSSALKSAFPIPAKLQDFTGSWARLTFA